MEKKGFLLLIALLTFVGQASACPGDFNGDGKINFSDYLLFVDVFETSKGDANYNAMMDLDGNGKIEFPDYLIFLGVFDTVCEATDRAVLTTLYEATDGDNWEYNVGWLSDDRPLNAWFGVTTDADGRVTSLYLTYNQLSGSIPVELAKLTNLTELNIGGNQLSGTIPVELANLSNLTHLDLYDNQLSGTIPSELANLSNLAHLSLGNNQFSGTIPVELANLSNLAHLDLSINQLSGSIPPELGSLTNLTVLSLGNNQFSGTIPVELANLSNLAHLSLGNNQFSGTIPVELANLSNLAHLGLSGNQLSGTIPPELANLTNLTVLSLGNNQFSGTIPPELGNLSNLTGLDLTNNQFSGTIPPELGKLTNLTHLSLYGNQLSGCIPLALRNTENIYSSLPSCGERVALVALYNATDGDNWKDNTNWLSDRPLGEWHGVSTKSTVRGERVRSLNLQVNDLSGTLPPELGYLSELETLFILSSGNSDKQIKGPIPPELGNLSNLDYLNLQSNGLSGVIPPELGKLSNLTWLYLGSNDLSGTIPPELGNLSKLTNLSLSGNQLSGCVPEGLRNVKDNDFSYLGLPFCGEKDETTNRAALVALYKATDGDNWTNNTNWLSDKPLREWHGVRTDDNEWVTSLELSGNGLRGSIPPELGNLAYLTGLNLAGNQISGAIPAELGNLWHLQYLYLGANQLSGCVPAGLWRVSDNDFADNGLSFCFLSGDGAALVALYEAMGGDGWTNNTNWLSDRPLHEWYGVGTDDNGRVRSLRLFSRRLDRSGNGLRGSIPPEVGELTNLVELIFSGNQLSGSLPPEVGKLTNLTYLDLYDNQLSGSIPPELGNLSKLRELDLRRNQLSGSLPPEVGKLTNLVELYLSGNQFSGPIPPELGNLSRLGWLDLYDNQLSGSIPPEVGKLSNLVGLIFSGNQFSGPIPPELGNLSRLKVLHLSGNQLSGLIPPELGNLTNLVSLWLGLNNLTDISAMGGLHSLTSLDLRGNPISRSAINASISALRRDAIVYHDHSLPLSESDFDIELVFLNDGLTKNRFTEFQKRQIRYAARRWMSIIRGDLPDYTIPQVFQANCGDQSSSPPLGERIDDLWIYVNVEELEEVKFYIGGVEEEFKPAALAGPQVIRFGEAGEPAAFLAVTGCIRFDLSWVDPNAYHIDPMPLIDITLHEIGHVLGIGTTSGFHQDSSGDPHFSGPLAIAAFDDAGGQNYTGAKVPVEPDGAHWRYPVLSGELMGGGRDRNLSAITIQALADLGYVVDVSQADPYTLPDAAATKVAASPQDWRCGFGQNQEPIYMVDQQGRVIRILSH